ncbi:cellulose synthase operon protein YhjQ [Pseudomonas sp. FSL R10-0765]|nr:MULTISPECIES: cellulose biosynthesis protein BcsQ [unclassified Pseudomonas]MQT41126.1 cellulose synthase operon protein YhjQ [Pseudomonas sp. FSL R10-0765]MQT54395.1 cellulose synthase operon protein YhjQ [Pseudomonas sp. FSL R10-2398]MQU01191.1 cellulose synthase operon protein YhjQ [Pseudomonas sp. FSL R10-2245]
MNRTDDISSLFSRFGASAGSYHEFESQIDYKENPPAPEPEKAPASPEVAVTTEVVADSAEAPLSEPLVSIEPVASMLEHPVSEPEPEPVPVAEAEQNLAYPVDAQLVPPTSQPLITQPSLTVLPAAPNRLRNLLAEVVQAREVEAQALAEEAVRQEAARGRPAKCKAHVVVVVSLKGGVGKTTLAAGLASRLRLEGGRTLAIDLDPQNALHYQLGVEHGESGIGSLNGAGHSWHDRLQPGFDGALLLAYGVLGDDEHHALTHAMHEDHHWLARQLDHMDLAANDVVLIDTPTGSTASLAQALDVADEVIVVTTADAASFNTLDPIDRLLNAPHARAASSHCTYVVNQFDVSREFSRDMLEVFKRRLGQQLIAVVPLDNTLGEALAYGRNPMSAAEPSPASEGVLQLAEQLKARFKASRAQGVEAQ